MPTTADQATTYNAFLSYSHAADGQLAPALQVAVQRFATPWYRLRRMRLFRDDTGLSANSGLWSSIEDALGQSAWFVLFASPDAAASEWVAKEVAWWLEHHGTARLLVVVTDGEFTWDDDGPSGNAVPPVLAAASMAEPRWIDLRWARTSEHVDRRDPRFREAVADLAATLSGVAKDFLIGEDVRQYRRGRRLATTAGAILAVLVLVAAVLGVMTSQAQAVATGQQKIRSANDMIVEADVVRPRDPQTALQLDIAAQGLVPGDRQEAALLQDLTGPYLGELPGKGKAARAATWSADGSRFAVADATGRLTLAAPDALGSATTLPVDSKVNGLAFTSDGTRLAVLTADRVALVPLADPTRSSSVPLPGPGVDVTVTAAGEVLVVANNQLLRWAPDGATTTQPLTGAGQQVVRAAFAPDGRLLATASLDGGVRLWDLTAAPQPLGVIAPTAAVGTLVAFDPAQHALVVGHADGTVEFWDITDPRTPIRPQPPVTAVARTLTAVAVDRSGQVAAASIDGSISLISGSSTTSLRTTAATPLELAFAPDGSRMVSGYVDGSIAVWDTAPDRGPQLTSVQPNQHAGALLGVESTHQLGGPFATAGNNGVVLWDTPEPGKLTPRPGLITTSSAAVSLAFSPDDHVLAIGTMTGHVCFVDMTANNPQCGRDVLISSTPVADLAFLPERKTALPEGKTVAAAGEGFGVRLIDVASGTPTVVDSTTGALAMAVTDDGTQLVTSYRAKPAYRRWDISDPSKPTALESFPTSHDVSAVQALAIAPKHTLVSAGQDGKIVLTALDSADELGEIPTAIGPQTRSNASDVLALSVSPDGRELAAAGDDGLVGLWDITDPSRPRPIGPTHRFFSRDVYGVAISADGKTLVAGGLGQQIATWDLRPDAQLRGTAVQTACARAGAPLSAAAWTRLTDLDYQDTCAGS